MPRHPTTPYEISKKRQAEEDRERERRKLDLFTNKSPYNLAHHYQLNPNNTVLRQFYDHSKCGRPPFGDREENPQRQAWEACLWSFLRKQFMKHDRQTAKSLPIRISRDKHMSEVVIGWLLEHFELYINNTLNVPEALKLFAAAEAEVDYKNCKDYWLLHSDTYL